MALPLMQKGHKIFMASQKIPSFADSYDMYTQVFSITQLRHWIDIVADKVDFFHVHNEPSWFVTLVKEIVPDKIVILDMHDSFLTRVTKEQHEKALDAGEDVLRYCVEERNNLQLADAVIFPSEPMMKIVKQELEIDEHLKPCMVLPSYVMQNLFSFQQNLDWHGGVVYEGRCDLPADINHKDKKYHKAGFTYTDMTDFARQCKALGLSFYIYARDDDKFVAHYQDLASIHPPVPYPELMTKISRHDWGLVGNSYYTPQWEIAEPNKLYEYIAAGVPPVVMYAEHCSRIVENSGIGITVDSVKELKERWGEHTECRNKLLKERGNFTMENNIHRLEHFYEGVWG